MYQSKGRFSTIVCPLSAGSECARPYCHFKHAPRGTANADKYALDKTCVTDSPVPHPLATCRLSGSSRDAKTEKPKAEPTVLKSHIPTIRVPQYRPTPLAILERRKQSSLTNAAASTSSRIRSSCTHQYVPQPVTKSIAKLVAGTKFSSDEDDQNEEQILKELFQKAKPAENINGVDTSIHTESTNDGNDEHQKKETAKTESKNTKQESSHSRHGHKSKKNKSESKPNHHSAHRHSSSSSSHKSSKDSKDSHRSSTSSSRKKDKSDISERSSSESLKKLSTTDGDPKDDKHHKSASSSTRSSSSHKSSRTKSSHKTKRVSSGKSSSRRSSSSTKSKATEDKKDPKRIRVESTSNDSEIGSESSLEATTNENGIASMTSKEADDDFTAPYDAIELSDEDPEAECLRLFQENEVAPQPTRSDSLELRREPSKIIEMVGTTRKRIAHDPSLKPAVPKKIFRPSPSQQLAMRLEAVAKRQISTDAPTSTVIERKRIASVTPSLIKAVIERNKLMLSKVTPATPAASPEVKTPPVQRVALNKPQPHATNHALSKGVSRVAHTATVRAPANDPAAPPRPRIAFDSKAKVPINVRQMYLEKLIDANNLACTTYEESYQKSLDEERDACQRSNDKKVYLSVMANLLVKIKKQSGEIKTPSTTQALSHADILGGPKAKKMSFSIEKNRFRRHTSVENITEEQFHDHLKANYLMTPAELESMGYPRPHDTVAGLALFRNEKALSAPPDPRLRNERRCSRCGKIFFVDDKGCYIKREPCTYHWGKNWTRKVKRGNTREQQYTCCDAESGSEGCCIAQGHVFENPPLQEDFGYCTTMASDSSHPKKVYSLDCEMIYTTKGTDLARVSVVDLNLKTVYEAKVMPENPVLDYNTRFSGLRMEDLENCATSIYEVQAVLLSMFTADTILMGHSLESDLKALKLIHSTVVDTSMVFPHKMGLPYKRALKNLVKDYCQKIIQDGVDGHDSAEDARACIELMLQKVKEDLKSM